MQLLGDLFGDLVGVGGDDGEFVGGLGAFNDVIAHKVGNEAVGDTQRYGLVVCLTVGVYKQRGKCHKGIENKGHHKEIGGGLYFVDVAGYHIRATGGSVVLHADAVDKAGDHTADNDREDGVMSLGIILQKSGVAVLQQQIGNGIDKGKHQRLDGKIPFNQKKCHTAKGYVDNQRHVTDTEAGLVLDHSGDTVQTCRCKMVFHDKDVVIQRQKNSNTDHVEIGYNVLCLLAHGNIPFPET